jgi:acyl carrier protein
MEVCRVLGIDPAHPVDEKQGLFELGMDSLMSIELKSRLEASVGRALPSTLTFNYPTIEDLSRYIETQVIVESVSATEDVSATPTPLHQDDKSAGAEGLSDDLSEEELATLLAKKLEQIR